MLNRNRLILVVLLFILPIVFASFFDKIRFHYWMLSFPIFTMIVAYLLERIKGATLKLAFLFLAFWIFSGNFQFTKEHKKPFENQQTIDEISQSIVFELKDPHSFQVKSYAKNDTFFDYPILDTILLVPLEEKLKVKLAEVSDDSPYNHLQINKADYIVLVCYKFKDDQDSDCISQFLKDNASYEVEKTLHTSEFISVYLARLLKFF